MKKLAVIIYTGRGPVSLHLLGTCSGAREDQLNGIGNHSSFTEPGDAEDCQRGCAQQDKD